MKNSILSILLLIIGNYSAKSQPIDELQLHGGTTIIAFLMDDRGWIVADSKVAVATNGVISEYKQVRKIARTKDIFYAFSEHPKVQFNDILIYDAFNIMDSTIRKKRSFIKSFESFDSAIVNKLNKTIDTLLTHNHFATLEEYTKNSFLGFLMVQYEKDKPSYKLRSYKFERTDQGYRTVIHSSEPATDGLPILFLGSKEAVFKYIESHPNLFSGFMQIKEKLVCLVAQEIQASPDHVGFPIDAVKITKHGHKWYCNNMECNINNF